MSAPSLHIESADSMIYIYIYTCLYGCRILVCMRELVCIESLCRDGADTGIRNIGMDSLSSNHQEFRGTGQGQVVFGMVLLTPQL